MRIGIHSWVLDSWKFNQNSITVKPVIDLRQMRLRAKLRRSYVTGIPEPISRIYVPLVRYHFPLMRFKSRQIRKSHIIKEGNKWAHVARPFPSALLEIRCDSCDEERPIRSEFRFASVCSFMAYLFIGRHEIFNFRKTPSTTRVYVHSSPSEILFQFLWWIFIDPLLRPFVGSSPATLNDPIQSPLFICTLNHPSVCGWLLF